MTKTKRLKIWFLANKHEMCPRFNKYTTSNKYNESHKSSKYRNIFFSNFGTSNKYFSIPQKIPENCPFLAHAQTGRFIVVEQCSLIEKQDD